MQLSNLKKWLKTALLAEIRNKIPSMTYLICIENVEYKSSEGEEVFISDLVNSHCLGNFVCLFAFLILRAAHPFAVPGAAAL